MDDPDKSKILHESLNRREMALYDILKSWVTLGKVMGAIVILIGSIASALEYENRLLGAVIGFAVSSFAVAMIQLLLLGLPYGLLGGAPLGAIVGALVAFFKPAILNKLISPDNPSNLNVMLSSQMSRGVPNQLLIGAVVGACGGALLIGGLKAHGLIEDGVAGGHLRCTNGRSKGSVNLLFRSYSLQEGRRVSLRRAA